MKFKEMLREHKITIKDYSIYSGTPYRTVQNWVYGVNRTPASAFKLLEKMIQEK